LAVIGAVPGFVAVKEEMFPVPVAARPIDILSFVQLNTIVPPILLEVKFTAAVEAPLHTTWSAGSFTWADGLTVIVKV
jgi:hypothetical protein